MTAARIGIGYDFHRLEPGQRLIVGGVEVPHDHGAVGHSDGDALAHAICDALLGAAGLGDIGQHFPDNDPQWRGVSSLKFLSGTAALLRERQLAVAHIDATVVLERPKLAPHFPEMARRLAGALGIERQRINLKAKTMEGLESVGRGEAIAAHAIALLETQSS